MADAGTFTTAVLRAAARTHPGRVRLNNEDLAVVDAARGVFGVIDGIGGHAGGEVAAATARDVILQRLARPVGTPAERVREAIAIANNEIYRRAADSGELAGMACVITLAIVADDRLTIGHVGDTRLYKLRPSGIRKVTRDHSPVGEREDAGELSEMDAMRHPRRHEVFRDVGTASRDKDEEEFVDVIEESLEPDAAILLCSDGLTDMLPASAIAHIVRQHAGNPERVVEALVDAANDAGGRDNVTVVYAEMPLVGDGTGGGSGERLAPTDPARMGEGQATPADVASGAQGRSRLGRALHALVSSRTMWCAAGALAGVIGTLALTAYVSTRQGRGSETLVVAPDGGSPFGRIMSAIDAARPGDVVRVEPGVYPENVEVRDGIYLLARVPGTVTIAGGDDPAIPPLSMTGALNVRVAGIRIDSAAPRETAVRITTPAATLDLVEITGQVRHALTLSPESSVTIRGSRLAVTGAVLALPDDGHATLLNCVLIRTTASGEKAVSMSPAAHLVLRGNVFAGFGADVIDGIAPPARAALLAGNIVVPAEPPGTAASRGGIGATPRPPANRGRATSGTRAAPEGQR